MHFVKFAVIWLVPVMAVPVLESPDVVSDDAGSGFLVSAKILLEDYDTAPMIPVSSLRLGGDFSTGLDDRSLLEWQNLTVGESDLEGRAARETRVFLGKTLVDYGCAASVRIPLGEAIHSLCSNGFCDDGSVYTRKVKYMDRGPLTTAWLQIRIEGRYYGRHTRGYVAGAVKSMAIDKTVQKATRYYYPSHPLLASQRCVMSKFPNYIHVSKDFGDKVDMRIRISLNPTNGMGLFSSCFNALR